jgi:hypothetical protein
MIEHIRRLALFGKHVLQRHGIALGLVALACLIGQVATLTQHPFYHLTSDSGGYIRAALRPLHGKGPLYAPDDPPGYPAFLMLIFLLNPNGNPYNAVVIAQAVLMILAIFEVYALTYRLAQHRWVATVVASALALNIYLMDWEREIMTEAMAFWLVLTAFVLFEHAMRAEKTGWFLAAMVTAGAVVLVRPFFIYVPVLLVVVAAYRVLRQRKFRIAWKSLLAALALGYALTGAVTIGNSISYGFTGITYVGTINLLGKIMEYHMQTQIADPADAALSADLNTYMHSGFENEPWHFTLHYLQYTDNYYAPVAHFNDDVILHHPFTYAGKSLQDIWIVLGTNPGDYAHTRLHTSLVEHLQTFNADELLGYWLLPLQALAAMIWLLYDGRNSRAIVLGALGLLALLNVIIAGAFTYRTTLPSGFTYDEFYRMRVPCDWVMVLLLIVLPVLGVQALLARRSARKTPALVAAGGVAIPEAETYKLPVVTSFATDAVNIDLEDTVKRPAIKPTEGAISDPEATAKLPLPFGRPPTGMQP